MNFKNNLKALAAEFGTHEHCIELWLEKLNITNEEISFALSNFDKRQRFNFISRTIRPMDYLIKHPELLQHPQTLGIEVIQSLPKKVYEQHLEQLKIADKTVDAINKRSFPYNEYDAQVFAGLYHFKKKADITFIRRMFGRKISHSSYPKAKQKLAFMTKPFGV